MISVPKSRLGEGALESIGGFLEDRPLVISSPGALSSVSQSLDLSRAQVVHVKGADWETLVSLAAGLDKSDFSCCLAVGGGRNIDVAKLAWKAVVNEETESPAAKRKAVIDDSIPGPLIAVPTTCGSGSEASAVSVVNIGGKKVPVFNPQLLPDLAVVDPSTLVGLPEELFTLTLWDALCHGLESFVSPLADDLSRQWSALGAKLAIKCLSAEQIRSPIEIGLARTAGLAAFAAGVAASAASVGLTHAIAHCLEPLEAAEIHSSLTAKFLLPVLRFNAEKVPGKYDLLAAALGLADRAELLSEIERLMERCDLRAGDLTGIGGETITSILRDPCARTNPTFISGREWEEMA